MSFLNKKILIVTKDGPDIVVENTINYVKSFGGTVIRVNGDHYSSETPYSFGIDEGCSVLFKENILSESFESIWLHRWSNNSELLRTIDSLKTNDVQLVFQVINYYSAHLNTIKEFFLTNLKASRFLIPPNNLSVNKLNVLRFAEGTGLTVPGSIVTNNKKDLTLFLKRCGGKIVLKDLTEFPFFLKQKKSLYMGYTEAISQETLNALPDVFPSSFFQGLIDKWFEIRSFYLGGTFFSMAIFSQENKNTSVDYRKYDFSRPNRVVPYRLPKSIEIRLSKLMDKLNLTLGVLDLIRDTDGNYLFLEVNPVGQFGDVSRACNYNLELEVAKFLVFGKNNRDS